MSEYGREYTEARLALRKAAEKLLEINGGDTYDIEDEISEAILNVLGKSYYVDIHD